MNLFTMLIKCKVFVNQLFKNKY